MNTQKKLKIISDMAKAIREDLPNIEFDMEYPNLVLSDGDPDLAKIVVVARDLGMNEVRLGKPLIGRAGQVFRECIFGSINFKQEDIYMTNTVPYKPIGNKAFSDEIRNRFKCILKAQLQLIKPKGIITLGREAYETVIGTKVNSILKEVINIYTKQEDNIINEVMGLKFNSKVVALAHPSYIARQGGINSEAAKTYFIKPLLNLRINFKYLEV